MVEKKKPWWKDENVNGLEISGFITNWDVMGYDKHGINIQVEPIKKTETLNTIKVRLSGYYMEMNKYGDPSGDVPIRGAKKIITLNSKTTKTQMIKIIYDFHKSAKGKLYRMK